MCGTEAKHSMPAAQVVMRVHVREEKCFARGVFFLATWQNTVLISVFRKQIRAIWTLLQMRVAWREAQRFRARSVSDGAAIVA
jgi:hypothetical protein